MADDRLSAAAAVAVVRLGTTGQDAFLVVSNEELRPIASAIAAAAGGVAASVRHVEFPRLSRHGEEPPDDVAAAMLEADVLALVTATSLSHTQARVAATRRGARVASLPDVTLDMFQRTVAVDYAQMEQVGDALAARLSGAERCRLTAPGGTDVELVLSGREGRNDDGDLAAPGAFGNLPAGEAYIAPVESEGSGTIVFDGSLAGFGLLHEPLRVTLEGGRAAAAEGGQAAEWLLRTLDAGGPNGRQLAELGIGTNPAAGMTGKILEDEKALRTVHLAFGASAGIGGVNTATVHIDGVLRDPTVVLDGVEVLRHGLLSGGGA
jgi:leucyl aminopeptidase (aminopeptidase T)